MAAKFGPGPNMAAIFGPTGQNVADIFGATMPYYVRPRTKCRIQILSGIGPNMTAIFGPGPNVAATFGPGRNVSNLKI